MKNTSLVKELNEAQKSFDGFEGGGGAKEVCDKLRDLRPSGYIAEHGDESCRVFLGSSCLTPLRSVSQGEAIELAIKNRIQLEVRYSLASGKWFEVIAP